MEKEDPTTFHYHKFFYCGFIFIIHQENLSTCIINWTIFISLFCSLIGIFVFWNLYTTKFLPNLPEKVQHHHCFHVHCLKMDPYQCGPTLREMTQQLFTASVLDSIEVWLNTKANPSKRCGRSFNKETFLEPMTHNPRHNLFIICLHHYSTSQDWRNTFFPKLQDACGQFQEDEWMNELFIFLFHT